MGMTQDKHNDEDNCMMNLRLMKSTGFFQFINPEAQKRFWFNPYKAAAIFEVAYCFVGVTVLLISTYHFRHNTFNMLNSLMLANTAIFITFKIHFVIRYKEIVWNSLEMTSISFLSYPHHDRRNLRTARFWSVKTTTIFAMLWTIVASAWILSPMFINNVYVELDFNGVVRRYRYNSLNTAVYPVTEEFYNEYFFAFYVFEVIQIMCWCHSVVTYDAYVISMCITISSQLKTIGDSYSRLCMRLEDTKDNELEAISRLKQIIQDHQMMIKSMREFYKLLQPVAVLQIANQSLLIVLQALIICINFYNGVTMNSVSNINLILAILPNIAQLFTTCYLFGIINEQKNLMNFALYKSDWTKMGIKYKKMMLLAMRMNDTEKLELRGVSSRKSINLELFASVMHATYSIISLLTRDYRKTSKTLDLPIE